MNSDYGDSSSLLIECVILGAPGSSAKGIANSCFLLLSNYSLPLSEELGVKLFPLLEHFLAPGGTDWIAPKKGECCPW